MNSTDNDNTKVSKELQEDLALYGITRKDVMEKAPPKKDGKANFFGVKEEAGGKLKLKFTDNIVSINKDKMMVGMATPENKSFDLLVTKNFKEAVTKASKNDLRSFIRQIVKKA